jgi:hypothetical protein
LTSPTSAGAVSAGGVSASGAGWADATLGAHTTASGLASSRTQRAGRLLGKNGFVDGHIGIEGRP